MHHGMSEEILDMSADTFCKAQLGLLTSACSHRVKRPSHLSRPNPKIRSTHTLLKTPQNLPFFLYSSAMAGLGAWKRLAIYRSVPIVTSTRRHSTPVPLLILLP